jgi:hypothetical protein
MATTTFGTRRYMQISINEQYRIISDPNQWIVQKKRTRKGSLDWESIEYYSSPTSAINSLGERLVRESDAVGFTEAVAAVEKITTSLSQVLTVNIQDVSHPSADEGGL